MLRRSGIACAGLLALFSAQLQAAPIDTASRSAVVSAYQNVYLPNLTVPAHWTGSLVPCNPGTTDAAYQQATIDNANFYRALAGLPAATRITSDPNVAARAQAAALIMAANQNLSHTPPSTWTCYSAAGAQGAGASNLSLGYGNSSAMTSAYAGPGAIDSYIDDNGNPDLGHRRWVLYQSQIGFATGDVVSLYNSSFTLPYSSANALRVMPASGTTETSAMFWSDPPSGAWVAWPSPNFVPYQVMPSTGYWSVSYPGATFSAATTVTVSDSGGNPVAVTGVAGLAPGYGDNTLRFTPAIAAYGPNMNDASYKVEVANVGGAPDTCYTVTLFDPNKASATDAAPDLCASAGKQSQSIAFTSIAPSPASVGGTYTATATASPSNLTVTFSSATPGICTVTAAGAVTFTATGTCTVNADQAGNATYDPAPQAQQTIAVGKQNQTIHFNTAPPASVPANSAYTVNAAATSGLTVALSIDPASTAGACSVTGSVVTFSAAGTCIIDLNQAGNASFNAAPQLQQTITVTLIGQTIAFGAQTPNNYAVAAGSFTITQPATASSGLPISYAVAPASVCTIAGTTVTIVGAGTCAITASQAGDAAYAPATPVVQNVAIGLTSQTIDYTFTPPANSVSGDNYTIVVTASGGSGSPVTFTASGACTVVSATGVVTFTGAGVCTVTANQAGNATYAAASPVQKSFTVKSAQTLTFPAQASHGLVVNGTFPLAPAASASSALAVSYSSLTPSVCSISGAVVTMLATGTCTIAADQGGNATFAPAAQVTQNIAILNNQSITFTSAPPANPAVGDTYTVSATGGASGNAVTFSIDPASTAGACSIAANVVTFNATTGTCIVDANQSGSATYAAAAQAQQRIPLGLPPSAGAAAAVPALNDWALALLAALLAAAALAGAARRRN